MSLPSHMRTNNANCNYINSQMMLNDAARIYGPQSPAVQVQNEEEDRKKVEELRRNMSSLHTSNLDKRIVCKLIDNIQPSDLNLYTNNGFNLFHLALDYCDEERALSLLSLGADPGRLEPNGQTALHLAVEYKLNRVALQCLNKGAHPLITNRAGESSYNLAHIYRRIEILELFYERFIDMHAPDADGNTPFLHACFWDRIKSIKLYLKHRVNIHVVNNNGDNGLHIAVKNGNTRAIKLLKPLGVDHKKKNKNNESPLDIALKSVHGKALEALEDEILNGYPYEKDDEETAFLRSRTCKILTPYEANENCNFKVVKFWLSKGFDAEEQLGGSTPWGWKAFLSGNDELAKCFIEHNLSPSKVIHGTTPLHICVKKGWYEAARACVLKGALLDVLDEQGKLPFDYVHEQKLLEFMELLYIPSAKIDTPDSLGMTPFLHACAEGHMGLAKFYIDRGVNLNAVNLKGHNALFFAIKGDFFALARLLIKHGIDKDRPAVVENSRIDLGCLTAHRSSITMAQIVIPEVLNMLPENKRMSMYDACVKGDLEVINFWLSKYPLVSIDIGRGYTLLHLACKYRQFPIIELLLSRYSNLNLESLGIGEANRSSPLTCLMDAQRPDLVERLLKAKANPNAEINFRGRPLKIAEEFEEPLRSDYRKLLLAHGAK